MNYWYVGKKNEILVDMDKPKSSLPHAEARLAGAIDFKKLFIKDVETHNSFSESHIHILITLAKPIENDVIRAVWGLMFHSDIYRGLATIMRIVHGVDAPDILITPTEFNREPDATCECEHKHEAKVMDVCPAAIALRDENRLVSFFGRPVLSDKKYFTPGEKSK